MGGAAGIEDIDAIPIGLVQPTHVQKPTLGVSRSSRDRATLQSESQKSASETIVFDQFLANSSITLFRNNYTSKSTFYPEV